MNINCLSSIKYYQRRRQEKIYMATVINIMKAVFKKINELDE